MKKAILLSTLALLAMVLTGCVDLGYYDQPVKISSDLEATMNNAVLKLKGKWEQVKDGPNPSHGMDLTFKDGNSVKIVVYVSSPSTETASYKLGYDWKTITNGNGENFLEGHMLFPSTNRHLNTSYICRISENGKSMSLCPDYDTIPFEDPTMHFVKVEDESDNNE